MMLSVRTHINDFLLVVDCNCVSLLHHFKVNKLPLMFMKMNSDHARLEELIVRIV